MPTIGVCVTIPEPFGAELQRMRGQFGDPLASSISPHVTLLPPTPVADEVLPGFVEHLRSIAAAGAGFPMQLRGTGTFRPISPVVFVQVAKGVVECETLERAVRGGPIDRELEFAYHPHVTVAHHVPDDALDQAFSELSGFECSFDVTGIDLYKHGTDGVWRPAQTFALGG